MKKKQSIKLLILCIFISTFLHVFLALKYKGANIEPPQPPDKQAQSNGGGNTDDNKTNIWVSSGIVPCDSYEGIGVQFSGLTNTVLHVAPDSPADKAGLRVNDELVTQLWEMDLMFGQKIDLVIIRDGKRMVLPVVVDRICHE